ncbi:hypothetical protein Pla22_02970 [Rubripirellula amarantea]|uniref:Uncharacterized protein n=2 Tax=Rubripirellula amarantea TaxID=2527999 RepID=A0A5C5WRD1_9BACT|nr:hypothetical protein Pla22_02970 [Rubripirellula amarantea]
MRWRLLFALIGLSITGVSSLGQRPPEAEGLPPQRRDSGDGEELHADYFKPSGVVRFQLVQARICLDAPRHRKGSQSRTENQIYESITVTANRGIPSVHYICETPQQSITLHVQDAQHLRIESHISDDGNGTAQRCVLDQPETGMITLAIGDLTSESAQSYQSSNLLHLRLQTPEIFDKHFARVISRMLHGESLKHLSERTLQAVIAESRQPIVLNQQQVEALIQQLDHPQRRKRVQAERELLSHGTSILPMLHQSLDHDRLSVEQRSCIKAILSRLRPTTPDRPASLAKMLINDASYWEAVIPELSFVQREIADARFTSLGCETTFISNPAPKARLSER